MRRQLKIWVFGITFLLTGCTSQIANRIETYSPMRNMQPSFFDDMLGKEHCYKADSSCLDYLSFGNAEYQVGGEQQPFDSFQWSLTLNEAAFDDVEFKFPTLGPTAPVIFLFPGYGMTATAAMVPAGLYFRSLGFHVVAMPGPTEQRPFQFGLGGVEHALELATAQFTEQALYAYSVSMGVLALTEFERQLNAHNRALEAAIVSAPMVDFRANAATLFSAQRAQDWRYRWIGNESFDSALDEIFIRTQMNERNLQLVERLPLLPRRTLVISAENDKIAPPDELAALLEDWPAQLVELGDMGHIMLGFANQQVRDVMGDWLSENDLLPPQPQ